MDWRVAQQLLSIAGVALGGGVGEGAARGFEAAVDVFMQGC